MFNALPRRSRRPASNCDARRCPVYRLVGRPTAIVFADRFERLGSIAATAYARKALAGRSFGREHYGVS